MSAPHFPQDPAGPLLTTREAARHLGVSLRTIQLWVEAGTLAAGRTPGGHRRIRMSAVTALAGQCGIKAPDGARVSSEHAKTTEALKLELADLKLALADLLTAARRIGIGETGPAVRAATLLGDAS